MSLLRRRGESLDDDSLFLGHRLKLVELQHGLERDEAVRAGGDLLHHELVLGQVGTAEVELQLAHDLSVQLGHGARVVCVAAGKAALLYKDVADQSSFLSGWPKSCRRMNESQQPLPPAMSSGLVGGGRRNVGAPGSRSSKAAPPAAEKKKQQEEEDEEVTAEQVCQLMFFK
jgi:hypothetical protein